MFRRPRLSVRTNHGLSEGLLGVLSSSQLFSIVLGYYIPNCAYLSTIFSVFHAKSPCLQITVYRDAPMGNGSLFGRQLSNTSGLSRFDSSGVQIRVYRVVATHQNHVIPRRPKGPTWESPVSTYRQTENRLTWNTRMIQC